MKTYKMLNTANPDTLMKQVNAHLQLRGEDSWQLYGPPIVKRDDTPDMENVYIQVLVNEYAPGDMEFVEPKDDEECGPRLETLTTPIG